MTLLASFLGLPRWVHALAGAGLLIAAFFVWLHFHDGAVVDRHEAGVQQQVQATAGAAATAAAGAVDKSKNQTEQANEQARNAAARSPDDPLRAGFDSLRKQRTDQPASR